VAIASAIMVARAPTALAACHHFTVAASPNPVAEGQTLTVAVSRDGAVNASHVDVSTVDETAKAGQDYVALHRTVSFTNETKQSFSVSILDDKLTAEPSQTFKLHLSNPGGCAINPNYVLDPDVRVTIAENDSPPASSTSSAPTAPSTPRAVTTRRSSTPTSTGSPTSTSSPGPTLVATETTTSTSVVTTTTGSKKKGGGGSGGVILAVVAAVAVALVGGGYVLYRRRST
jgi:hypothetical protein